MAREIKKREDNFLNKLQGTLFYPGRFFSKLKEKNIFSSILFFILVSTIYLIIDFIIDYSKYPFLNNAQLLIIPFLFVYLISILILVLFILLIETLYFYIFILLFKVKLKFIDVLRFKAYTSSPIIFAWIPYIGIPLAFIWSIVIEIIGLSKYGKISMAKSVLVVFIPIILVLLIALLIVIFAFAFILASPIGFLIKYFF